MRQGPILLGLFGIVSSQASAFDSQTYVLAINVQRRMQGSGPLSDTIYGEDAANTGTATVAIDAPGVQATSEVHAENPRQTAFVHSEGDFVNYFTLVPRSGFDGTRASVEFTITVDGSMMTNCRSMAEVCGSSIWVLARFNAGLADDFAASQVFSGDGDGCTDPEDPFRCASLSRTGTLSGSLPVNRRLPAGGVLFVEAAGIADSQPMVDGFGQGSISYTATSSDPVDIIWDLPPPAPKP